jgi:hypothetical protein
MPWNEITSDDVREEGLTPQEVATLKNIDGANDALTNILARAIKRVRGAIRAGGYPLSDTATEVPDQVNDVVIDISVWRWLKKYPQMKALQTKERQDAYSKAVDRLEKIANQKESIEPPDADTNTSAQPLPGQWNSENKILGRAHPAPTPATQFPSGNANRPYANPEGTEDK